MDNRCYSSSSFSRTSSLETCSAFRSASPKSPPPGLDLYGKRRHIVKVKVLEREITLLQEELKLLDGLQPASSCCKELDTYIESRFDPFIANTKQENDKSYRFRNKIWYICSILCLINKPLLFPSIVIEIYQGIQLRMPKGFYESCNF